MLDIRWVRENTEALDDALKTRGAEALSSRLVALDEKRREIIGELQELQSRRNSLSKEIGIAKSKGESAETLMAEMQNVGPRVKALEEEERRAIADFEGLLATIPNIPEADVPVGADENENVELRQWGAKKAFSFTPKQHFELGESLGMDFESGTRLAGARFCWLQGNMARLERALAAFMLDTLRERGFMEVAPPLLVSGEVMFGTGQLPKFEEDQFQTTDGRWLIPTAEVPLTNFARDRILPEAELPYRFCAWTPCFRKEAGAAGKDTRGYIRQHQFWKVEMVQVVHPETSEEALDYMTETAETVLQKLNLPYRVIVLCTGDMGFSARKTYDIEVWLPGQNTYREISSCSNCGDFQARRMKARVKGEDGKPYHPHTLNGSGLAVGRTLVAVLENYQNEDGSVTVPEVLRSYLGGLEKLAG